MKRKTTIQPDARMVRALRGIPGATFAMWFRVNSGAARKGAVALIAAGASGIARDRLFFIHKDAANEIILGCPNCRKELFRIGAKTCHNCGFTLVPASDKSLKTNWKKLLSTAGAVAGLAAYLLGSHAMVVAISLFLAILGLVANALMIDADKVKLLYRLNPDGAFIEGRVLKLSPKEYTSPGAPASVAMGLADDLVGLNNANIARRDRAARPKESSSQDRPSLSEAFSLGKQKLQ